jgi:hypothetical protein
MTEWWDRSKGRPHLFVPGGCHPEERGIVARKLFLNAQSATGLTTIPRRLGMTEGAGDEEQPQGLQCRLVEVLRTGILRFALNDGAGKHKDCNTV